jgi:hypothetical protein
MPRAEEITDIQDRASVKEAANALGQHYADLGFTGPDPYFEASGKGRADQAAGIEKGLDDFISQTRKGWRTTTSAGCSMKRPLPSARHGECRSPARGEGGQAIRRRRKRGSRHRIGRIGAATYLADPKHGEQQIATGLDEIDTPRPR